MSNPIRQQKLMGSRDSQDSRQLRDESADNLSRSPQPTAHSLQLLENVTAI